MILCTTRRQRYRRHSSFWIFLILNAAALAARADEQPPADEVVITARHLNEARDSIQTNLGATLYALTDQSILNQPGGADIPLNQTLLQAPGVSQDAYGQIHLRNDHGNIQYRIDGVILPEGISFFGQSLASRFASSINLITGSLPAQYGLVTTGIVDIQTKSGAFKDGGSIGLYGGSNGWVEPSAEYSGSSGGFNYYVSGDLTQNELGVENPTAARHPIHDQTRQAHGFALLQDIIDPDTKISAIFGYYQGSFQIPNNPGQVPAYGFGSRTSFDSSLLNEHQLETNDYGVVTYLHAGESYDVQVSAFERYGRLGYTPDAIGDLMFYGLTQSAVRQDISEGIQADGTYRLAKDHTLRFGTLLIAERALGSAGSEVFHCLAPDCSSVATSPVSVSEQSGKTGTTYSVYLQDEWTLTPDITVNYGLRYDVLNGYTNTDQLSPRANIVWKPDEATTFHAGYSRYFTPPSLELISGEALSKFAYTTGYPSGYSPTSPPQDAPILPERSNYYDVGAERILAPGLKIGLDGYIKIAKDLIDEGQFGAPIILAVYNYGHGNVFGAEFTTSYDSDDWAIYGNFSFGRERATDIVSQQFNFTPDQLAFLSRNYIYTDHSQWYSVSGGVSYNLDGTHLNADLVYGTGLRQSVNNIPNGSTVAPYAQINLGANHHFEDLFGSPVDIGINVINLTDRDYILRAGSGVGVFAPQYGPRRAFYSSVRWSF